MSHYFDTDLTIKDVDIDIKYSIFDRDFVLKSSNGVFSKSALDRGTEIFLKCLIKIELLGEVLDLGCGIGTVGITLAHFNNCDYTLVDVNERAVNLAKINIEKYNLTSRCEALVSNIFENIENKFFDAILLNPPIRAGKSVIYKMYQDSYEHLNSGGSLFIVIRVKQGALTSFKFLSNIFKTVKVIEKSKGYQVIRCIK